MPQESPKYPSPPTPGSNTARQELEYMAYHGQHAAVYERYKNIPEEEWDAYQSASILNSVIKGGMARLKKSKPVWEPTATGVIDNSISNVEHDLNQFIQYCTSRDIRPRQLYECILDWSNALPDRAKLEEALRFLEKAEELNIRSYPDLYAKLILKRAELLFEAGRLGEAQQILSNAAEHYYLFPDRNIISAIILLLGQTSLLTGEAIYFKDLLFSGLRHFYTRDDVRRLFTDRLIKTHRSAFRLLRNRDVLFNDKVLFLFHWLDHTVHKSWMGRKGQLDRLTRMTLLAVVYFMNYVVWQDRSPRLRSLTKAQQQKPGPVGAAGARRRILVTRAMGGIGDLLMMTPGLHALKLKFPSSEIQMAIPRKFAPLFAGNEDVTLIDIETADLDMRSYEKWFNLTDCPAARIESRTMPNVAQSRIDIFAQALGIRGGRLRKMSKLPRYFITELEKDFQLNFWKNRGLEGKTVIGIQLQAAESYRDYPRMADLVRALSQDAVVLLFHTEKTDVGAGDSIIDPGPITIRQAFALAAACSAIVAPDSAFVHFAGALNIPCVALYGPIDGRIRTMHYPFCIHVDIRSVLRCVPCWRNEIIPCKLTNMRNSACMTNITTADISGALNKILSMRSSRADACERKTYGT